jgi:hypothetical protein
MTTCWVNRAYPGRTRCPRSHAGLSAVLAAPRPAAQREQITVLLGRVNRTEVVLADLAGMGTEAKAAGGPTTPRRARR